MAPSLYLGLVTAVCVALAPHKQDKFACDDDDNDVSWLSGCRKGCFVFILRLEGKARIQSFLSTLVVGICSFA